MAQSRPDWHNVAIVLGVLIYIAFVIWEIVEHYRLSPTRIPLEQPKKIKAYMRRWLTSGGRAVIFTRDMSWADEQDVRNILFEKARRGELIICIQDMIQLATDLQQAGAQILPYVELGHVPRSRYTIIDFEKDGARVAVGGAVGKYHVIQEYRNGEHPFFSVAEDLVKILIAYQRIRNVPAR
jgi:hypothetical protein